MNAERCATAWLAAEFAGCLGPCRPELRFRRASSRQAGLSRVLIGDAAQRATSLGLGRACWSATCPVRPRCSRISRGGAMQNVRVLLFDVFGTLVDWRGSIGA